ncbi:MAG TPA: hypothetical protein VF752_12780 [Thermoleophilaceae bacterium]
MAGPVNLIAHFADGPVAGRMELLEARMPTRKVWAPRGWLRRTLKRGPRTANYTLERSWLQDGEHHLLYRFAGTSRA